MATRDNKITTNTETKSRQKRTRNKRHMKEEDKRIGDENGHRGRKKKVPEIIMTKPVIESTNPFFIAVCAPETYKPKAASNRRVAGARIVDDVEKNNRTNVFLRQRTRNSLNNNNNNNNNNNINRFIHHPLLQQSRDSDVSATATESQQHAVIELSNEILFPSLGKPTTTTTTTPAKLNFKEMVMKNSTVAVAGVEAAASESPVVISKDSSSKSLSSFTSSCRPLPSSHKSISSGNIFLAAFQNNHNDDDEYDDYCDTVSEKPFVSSSSLIDSCDRKYDRLYS
jgi:hypothetical protein